MRRILPEGKRILVAEDDEINRLLVQEMLYASECEAEIVVDGKEAVRRAKEECFAMIFLDIKMPVMNGYDAARAIREFNKDVPIIALTAHAMEWVPAKCNDVGMNAVVFKPFTMAQFEETIIRWAPRG
jgi:CheY-like chemotaxis protein